MNSIKDILNNIPPSTSDDRNPGDLMKNADYLRHSSSIISEALQKGCDVLQLENGDIVTTGTKVVVTQFHWDESQQKMVKISAKERKRLEVESRKKSKETTNA